MRICVLVSLPEKINMPVIQTSFLKKEYSGNYVLKGITLFIDAGQVVGYIGGCYLLLKRIQNLSWFDISF